MKYGQTVATVVASALFSACLTFSAVGAEDDGVASNSDSPLTSLDVAMAEEEGDYVYEDVGEIDYDEGCNLPWLTGRFGMLYMTRESPDNVPMVLDNNGAGPVAFSGSDFDMDWEPGLEAALILNSPRFWCPVEFRYMWINPWEDLHAASGLTNPVFATNPNIPVGNTMDYAYYTTEFQSFEINFRKTLWGCCTTLLAGFRYVSLDEDLDFGFGADQFWWSVDNDLFGFQLGIEHILYDNGRNFALEGFIKAGVYANDSKVMAMVPGNQQPWVDDDHVAFLGEMGLVAVYDFNNVWSVRCGYQALWLDGVLNSANQVSVTDNLAQTAAFDYTTTFFHGGLLQLERRF